MPTSPDTLLRRVKGASDEPAPPPRYVGVGDWAVRKGQRYGTILIDLERGHVIDILPGRDGAALKAWLKQHPGVEVITRDRWSAYAQAATEGAPEARQVADRWHLLRNLREAVQRLLERRSAPVRAALQETPAAPAEGPREPAPSLPPVGRPATPRHPSAPQKQARQARHQERARQYERVKELRAQGQSLRQIARATGLSKGCVIRYLRTDRRPDWNPGRKVPTQLDPFAEPIGAWVGRGGRNAAELYRELVGRGFRGSYDAVRRYLARRLGSTGRPGPRVGVLTPPAVPPPSARKLSYEFIRRPEEREAEEQARLDRLRGCDPILQEGLALAGEFAEMVRRRSRLPLGEWLAKAEGSGCAELRSFAGGLRQDEAAVAAALTERWSNGPVEGAVNRLKLIKRSMYGRAGWELLRARVRYAG
jgi:transposase